MKKLEMGRAIRGCSGPIIGHSKGAHDSIRFAVATRVERKGALCPQRLYRKRRSGKEKKDVRG